MEAVWRWPLWLQGLALLWGRAMAGLEQISTTVPPAPAQACSAFSLKSCEECLKNVSMLDGEFAGVVNFEALLIAMAVVAGLILVSLTVCCCYCCYCRRRSRRRRLEEEEEQIARKREERRLQSLQRKHERKMKHDEIRKKYEYSFQYSKLRWDRFKTDIAGCNIY
ncbi:hypothetical protein EK904_005715, partial [Melospiza melodia maxima]